VYTALHSAGLTSFYQLRSATAFTATPIGATPVADAGAELDTEDFLSRHTEVGQDGSRSVELAIDGVHCAGCVWLVERLPHNVPGICEANLDLPRARLRLRWQPEQTRLSDAASWLSRFGYQLHGLRRDRIGERSVAERRLLVKVGVSWALAGNVMLIAAAMYSGLNASNDSTLTASALWVSLALTGVSVLYGGAEFFRRAAESVRAVFGGHGLKALSMDAPIALGISVGFAHSVVMTLSNSTEVWFDSIAVLIAALLTARWLQLRGRRLAGDAAERLLALIPRSATRLGADGVEEAISAELLQPGDRIRVRVGEAFPADGVIVAGRSSVNRAVLTGESRPEPAEPGHAVHAGSINVGAPVEVEIEAAGGASRVGRLLQWLEERSLQRAPIVQLADRIAGVFIAGILLASLVTALVWLWLEPSMAVAHTVSLLVIACPCALGMATPLALTVAAGQAARRGIFVKHDDVIELLTRATTVVLDKTGTLTEGRMRVVEVHGDAAAFELARRLERRSAHPIAVAMASTEPEHGEIEDVEEVGGSGLRGRVDGHLVQVGRPGWLAEALSAEPGGALQRRAEAAAAEGLTPVAIGVDGELVALVALGDPARADAGEVVSRLKGAGKEVVVLSGDHPATVRWLAGSLGIAAESAHGGVSPEQKLAFIEALRTDPSRVVVMVGDGVNDASALQAAHVGIAVGGSSEASVVGADIFLTRPGLSPVVELFDGARRVMGVVHRNLGVSLAYNAIGITLAALGLINPLVAAVAMPISSLFVVASSLLQRSFVLEGGVVRRASAAPTVSEPLSAETAPVPD